ncbi:MAG: hypothetical protein LBO00_03410 [Zoogloeaceae bacterium]|jgi:hypothetical protein|nr:hypothetical protein [Zoogloeaceae bacterium]
MSTVEIYATILAGNLGDGWMDQNEAAEALAEFTEKTWKGDIAQMNTKRVADGLSPINVEIEIEVQNAEGHCPDTRIEGDYDESMDVESAITPSHKIWVDFCESPEAAKIAVDTSRLYDVEVIEDNAGGLHLAAFPAGAGNCVALFSELEQTASSLEADVEAAHRGDWEDWTVYRAEDPSEEYEWLTGQEEFNWRVIAEYRDGKLTIHEKWEDAD